MQLWHKAQVKQSHQGGGTLIGKRSKTKSHIRGEELQNKTGNTEYSAHMDKNTHTRNRGTKEMAHKTVR